MWSKHQQQIHKNPILRWRNRAKCLRKNFRLYWRLNRSDRNRQKIGGYGDPILEKISRWSQETLNRFFLLRKVEKCQLDILLCLWKNLPNQSHDGGFQTQKQNSKFQLVQSLYLSGFAKSSSYYGEYLLNAWYVKTDQVEIQSLENLSG